VAEAITAARRSYDWVIVDMHPDYGPLNQGIFERADKIIVPVTPERARDQSRSPVFARSPSSSTFANAWQWS